jgi:hypothetical protein
VTSFSGGSDSRAPRRWRRWLAAPATWAAVAAALLAIASMWLLRRREARPPQPLARLGGLPPAGPKGPAGTPAVDVDGDGRITVLDALALTRRLEAAGRTDEDSVNAMLAAAVALGSSPGRAAATAAPDGPVRFRPVHVYVDPGGTALAAYQVEIVADGNAEIVGVEEGEHDAFAPLPSYDPAALAGDRIILAAFNTGSDLPSTRTRVATVNLREVGSTEPAYHASLQIAGDPDGRPIHASVELVPDVGDARPPPP